MRSSELTSVLIFHWCSGVSTKYIFKYENTTYLFVHDVFIYYADSLKNERKATALGYFAKHLIACYCKRNHIWVAEQHRSIEINILLRCAFLAYL